VLAMALGDEWANWIDPNRPRGSRETRCREPWEAQPSPHLGAKPLEGQGHREGGPGLRKLARCPPVHHSFATHRLERGQNIRSLQERLRHSNLNTSMIYSHVLNRGPIGIINPGDHL